MSEVIGIAGADLDAKTVLELVKQQNPQKVVVLFYNEGEDEYSFATAKMDSKEVLWALECAKSYLLP